MTDKNINEFYSKNFDSVLKELNHECDLLRDWFKKDFPECDLKLIVDVNQILRSFKITVRILMGEEMVQNRGFFENKIMLSEKDIINPSFMRAFFREFGNSYRIQISTAINRHYNQQRAIED